MRLIWSTSSREDYLYWQKVNKKIVKRINELVNICLRTPFDGIGKPEALKGDLQGYWSRHNHLRTSFGIKHNNNELMIAACRYHYEK